MSGLYCNSVQSIYMPIKKKFISPRPRQALTFYAKEKVIFSSYKKNGIRNDSQQKSETNQ